MTHYMELLATNQPWNLISFMAIPVILAETTAVTELFLLFGRNTTPSWVPSTGWPALSSGSISSRSLSIS